MARGRVATRNTSYYRRGAAPPTLPAVAVGTMPAKRRRSHGELAAPIVLAAPASFEGAATPKRVENYWREYEKHQRKTERLIKQQLSEKLGLLMKHYGIADQNDMAGLAIALAFAHVPGFQLLPETRKKRGRKRRWDGTRYQELFETVENSEIEAWLYG